ncbi:uncharacterized protein LOC123310375 [Coccinella septempunctata]|uniref:uncharacterized protein LOC123310375 n=1 Tax=Coccinella septempunctata TaxID=41139 RepID=UPI001D08134D|nr:uncharacterized protein LOC123310375 [Coccinella septempunctata]
METYKSSILIFLSVSNVFFLSVDSLECQYCSSTEYSSDCRKGTVKDRQTCTIKGEDRCYVEYIVNDGSKPLYRRGCAPRDWCKQQRRNQGPALKFCNTCQDSNCNNDRIKSEYFLSKKCRYCSSSEYSSDCRKGTVKDLQTCTIKGEDHCYEEYILNDGEKPLYRRGCAPGDWCKQQMGKHGAALKFCNTCQSAKCNNDIIGSQNASSLLCRNCESDYHDSACKNGTVNTYDECGERSMCIQYHFSTNKKDIWKRGCGDRDSCADLREKYGKNLLECKKCKYELCNNYPMKKSSKL